MRLSRVFISCLLMLVGRNLAAQDWKAIDIHRQKTTHTGMIILGSWGLANTVMGAIGTATQSGESRYFQQMNLIWGSVNLAIAGSNLLMNSSRDGASFGASVRAQHSIEKVFLVNAGLDLVYLTAGGYCLERAKHDREPDRYRGYGKSLLLQGGALLLFDVTEYLLHAQDGKKLQQLLDHVELSGNGVGFYWKF